MKTLIKDRNKRKQVKNNGRYTFDDFVVGKSNAIAYTLCLDVAKKQIEYNPIYVFSKVGLGKTHLLKSILKYYVEHYKNQKALYITCKEFVDNYLESIKKHTEKRMVEKFKNLNLLLVDEVEYLTDKLQTQDELLKIFNLLYESKVQMVFSSTLSIKKLDKFDERLKSRFMSGAMCEIMVPNYHTRLEILRLKLKNNNINYSIDDKLLKYIAKNVKSDIRKLEGILNSILTYIKIQNKIVDDDIVKKLLNNSA